MQQSLIEAFYWSVYGGELIWRIHPVTCRVVAFHLLFWNYTMFISEKSQSLSISMDINLYTAELAVYMYEVMKTDGR